MKSEVHVSCFPEGSTCAALDDGNLGGGARLERAHRRAQVSNVARAPVRAAGRRGIKREEGQQRAPLTCRSRLERTMCDRRL